MSAVRNLSAEEDDLKMTNAMGDQLNIPVLVLGLTIRNRTSVESPQGWLRLVMTRAGRLLLSFGVELRVCTGE